MKVDHILTKYRVEDLKNDDDVWVSCLEELRDEIKKQANYLEYDVVHSLAINNLCAFVGW